MMRSMFSGVSGLRIHQTKMDVIANNIANVNTVGFKASRVTFADVFSQTVQAASGANPDVGRGGVNPMQIGLGSAVSSIDILMTTGGAQRTDDPFHVMIQGDNGFFMVKDNSGTYYTRAGAFRVDEWNNLTIPNGMVVQGWRALPPEAQTEPNRTLFDKTDTTDVWFNASDLRSPPNPTTKIEVEGNLSTIEGATQSGVQRTVSFYDSLGFKFELAFRYYYRIDPATDEGRWDVEMSNVMRRQDGVFFEIDIDIGTTAEDGTDTDLRAGASPFTLDLTVTGRSNATSFGGFDIIGDEGMMQFNTNGTTDKAEFTGFIMTVDPNDIISPASTFGSRADGHVYINKEELTQFGSVPSSATSRPVDGNKAGELIGLSIGPDGIVRGAYDNDSIRELFQIPLARFANRAALSRAGNNLFTETANSGVASIVDAQTGGNSLMGGVLEMANVDLSFEFTEMITTQRGFQANSRIITVSDDMLAELVNLKR